MSLHQVAQFITPHLDNTSLISLFRYDPRIVEIVRRTVFSLPYPVDIDVMTHLENLRDTPLAMNVWDNIIPIIDRTTVFICNFVAPILSALIVTKKMWKCSLASPGLGKYFDMDHEFLRLYTSYNNSDLMQLVKIVSVICNGNLNIFISEFSADVMLFDCIVNEMRYHPVVDASFVSFYSSSIKAKRITIDISNSLYKDSIIKSYGNKENITIIGN